MIHVGDRVKVNGKNGSNLAFHGCKGTVINKFTAGNGFAFEVKFDYAICAFPWLFHNLVEDVDYYDSYVFFPDSLDLIEE